MGVNHLKKLSFELKGKETADKLNLTINNKKGKEEGSVNTNFELVHNYPINDNLKVKVRFKFILSFRQLL